MPLYLHFHQSFNKSLKKLDTKQKEIIALIMEALMEYYSSACDLHKAKQIAPGFFYKQLRKPYYEAGIERSLRIVIERKRERCTAVLAGKHDQIARFLAGQ